ncbi:MAG: PIN domain protein [Ignavibacteriae bacterium]|nr:PIN domain protein [Ignavibacteriota bacterium]
MRIYLDNCCFNRPFDDQNQNKVRTETISIITILEKIKKKEIDLVWSYILDYENYFNPFPERFEAVKNWKEYTVIYIEESENILKESLELFKKGICAKDSLHIASAIEANCDYFITTDARLIKKLSGFNKIKIVNPVDFK